ncbi:hypothetical protein CBL_03546 [Carabus blaptoides fortunei]
MSDKGLEQESLVIPKKGDTVQKLSVVENLPELMKFDPNETFNKILPKIQQELTHSTAEFHIATSKIFQVLIESHFKTDDGNVITTVLQGLNSKDPVVSSAWLETLLEVLLLLPIRVVHSDILPLAIQKGQDYNSAARITSCRLLGKIVLHPEMNALEIKKDILPVVYSLCQDVDYNVRGCICEQIPIISKALGANMVKNYLLSHLVELSSDDNADVRAVAVSSVVQILPVLDKDTKTSTMVPLVMQMCNPNVRFDDASSVVIAREMGLLLSSLDSCLTSQQADKIIYFYQKLAQRGLDDMDLRIRNVDPSLDMKGRQYCAINFPAVVSFTLSTSPSNLNHLYDIFRCLSNDPCYLVRITIAGLFHEVAQILGPKNCIMLSDFVRLLSDDAEEVLRMIVPHISTSFVIFWSNGTLSLERPDPVSNQIGKALLKCLSVLKKGYNWRLTTIFLKQLEALPMVFHSDYIHNEFARVILNLALHGRPKPVRCQAACTLLYFLKWSTKQAHRTRLLEHLLHDLGENKCCYTRRIFVAVCMYAMELFSNKYFKETFFMPVVELSTDPVATIRYSMVSLTPKLRKMLKLPQDKKLQTILDHAVYYLEKNETDSDVLANLLARSKEMLMSSKQQPTQDEIKRENRLIEEEANVAGGKVVFSPPIHQHKSRTSKTPANLRQPGTSTKQISRSQSVTKESTKLPASLSTSTPRSVSVPTKSRVRKEIISDMTFLKQHFYIDAGVDLPMEEAVASKSTGSSSITDKTTDPVTSTASIQPSNLTDTFNTLSLDTNEYSVDNCTVNMTDDVKVNMRRKKLDKSKRYSHSEIPMAISCQGNARNKRHSSVYTDSYLATGSVINKRRSLNIHQKEMSRIPVILRSVENMKPVTDRDSVDEDVKNVERKEGRRLSNLPVPIRGSK